MTNQDLRQAVVPIYTTVETKVGTDVYACIQCFEARDGQDTVQAFRVSAPFVLLRRNGSREVVPASGRGTLLVTHEFQTPRVSMGNRVDGDNKTVVVSVKGQFMYSLDDKIVHSESGDCESEIDYAEFFTRVAAKAGGESLLALGDRNERLRAGTT